MKLNIAPGTQNKIIHIFIQDSSKTTGDGLTGLDYNTSGLSLYYIRAAAAAAVEVTLAEIITLGTYVSGGFKEVHAVNLPGVYEFHPPNAMLATGASQVVAQFKGAAAMAPLPLELQLGQDIDTIKDDSTAATNLKKQYDTSGLVGDNFPATQGQLSSLGSGSTSGFNVGASGAVITTGNETNDYTATRAEDGIFHILSPDGGNTDFVYEYSAGGGRTGSSILWRGYVQGNNDSVIVEAGPSATGPWRQVGIINGTVGTTIQEAVFDLLFGDTGSSGPNLGKVFLRLNSTDASEIATDLTFCSVSQTGQTGGYEGGAIWVDTNASNTGTVLYTDGVVTNPVSTWAAALSLNSALGLNRFQISGGSSITLTSDSSFFELLGRVFFLILNGQDVSGLYTTGAFVNGIGTVSTSRPIFDHCVFGDVTLPGCTTIQTGFTGTFTAAASGDYIFDFWSSGVAGLGTPEFDFDSKGNINFNFRHSSGGVKILNMVFTDKASLEGDGQYILDASCTGGNLAVRGNFDKTDNSAGAVTINESARYEQDQVADAVGQRTIDDTITLDQVMVAVLAFAAGTTDGADTATLKFFRQNGTTAALTMTVDNNGERSEVVKSLT